MTLNVLRAATRMNLNSVRREVQAARDEGLITPTWADVILATHSLLQTCIEAAADNGTDPEVDAPTVSLGRS